MVEFTLFIIRISRDISDSGVESTVIKNNIAR